MAKTWNFTIRYSRKDVTLQVKCIKYLLYLEAVAQACSVKKVFLEISENSLENTCASLYFNKVAGLTLLE